jgi:hypothetical protein
MFVFAEFGVRPATCSGTSFKQLTAMEAGG